MQIIVLNYNINAKNIFYTLLDSCLRPSLIVFVMNAVTIIIYTRLIDYILMMKQKA